jgi:hypothetical protein
MSRKTNDQQIVIATSILLAVLFIVLVLIILVQANPGINLPGRDYGVYIYIGDQIVHGKLPYRDAWESKPPAIFYLNAIGLWVGRGSRWGIWMIEFITLLVATIFSLNTMKKLWGLLPALGGSSLWLLGLNLTLDGGNLTEEFILPLHFFSILLFLKLTEASKHVPYNMLLGLAFSISFLFRPNNAGPEVAAMITLLIFQAFRRDLRSSLIQILWLAIGILTPLFFTGVYFWSQGLLYDLVEASLLYNLTYSQTAITPDSSLISGFKIFGWISWIAAAGYLVALQYALKTREPIYFLLLIGSPLAIYFSDPSGRNYAHYFMNWLPFLGFLSGLLVHFLTERLPIQIKNSPVFIFTALTVALVWSFTFFFVGGTASRYLKALERFSQRDKIGIEVRTRTAVYTEKHTRPGELVLFWAASPGENFMSNREAPGAYISYPLYVDSDISQRISDQFLIDIITKRPVLIVDMNDHESLSLNPEQRAEQIKAGLAWEYPPDNLNEFFKFVEENYYLEAMIGNRTVYRLKEQ